ncbi:MAG: pyrimidine dimer DNA glycosylase/endonuclease V, partial [Deltaproteobacteria bacterium]|nr:pyrimidine dimer DNA glycosylase/endonuclease V [Deltaproteobacteria bacterium]
MEKTVRLWSLHPKYLDSQGLVAQWREGLLAKKVLEGKTVGYKNHPQLERFKKDKDPKMKINLFLHYICDEALGRGFK